MVNLHDILLNSDSLVSAVTLDGDGSGTVVSPSTDSTKPVWLHFDYSGRIFQAQLHHRNLCTRHHP